MGKIKVRLWFDVILPLLAIFFWVLITSSGYGPQSMSHLIEAPITLFFVTILIVIKIRFIDEIYANETRNTVIAYCISIMFVILLRSFIPFLPE